MPSQKKEHSYFDDDFEVTYEEEVPFQYNTSRVDLDEDSITPYYADDFDNDYDNDYDDDYDDYDDVYEDGDDYEYGDEYEDSYDDEYENDYEPRSGRYTNRQPSKKPEKKRRRTKRRRSYRPTRLAAPIQKGGNALLKLVQTIVRNLSALLILAIIALMTYNFLRGSAPYGDIKEEIQTHAYTLRLLAYLVVPACLILFELCSMLWTMTRVRVRDEYGSYKEDVGRGLFSFIFIYLCSYAAFLIHDWIPEIHEILIGFKGSLDVFGSMHNALFGLCLAGVISCLFRKYSLSL